MGQLTPCATSTEPVLKSQGTAVLKLMLHNTESALHSKGGRCSEKPARLNKQQTPHSTPVLQLEKATEINFFKKGAS